MDLSLQPGMVSMKEPNALLLLWSLYQCSTDSLIVLSSLAIYSQFGIKFCYWFDLFDILGRTKLLLFLIPFCSLLCFHVVFCWLKMLFVTRMRTTGYNTVIAYCSSQLHSLVSVQFSPDWHRLEKLCCRTSIKPEEVILFWFLFCLESLAFIQKECSLCFSAC